MSLAPKLGVTLLLLGLLSAPYSTATEETAQPVKVLEINTSQQMLPFAAEVEASERAQMAFRVPGQIEQLAVRMGQRVDKDQLLAWLDPTDYQLALQARQAELDLATIAAERDAKLFAKGLISEDQHDRTQTKLVTAAAQLNQAKVDLADTELRAPFDGYVSYTYALAAEISAANNVVMVVENNDHVDLSFNLPVPYASKDIRQPLAKEVLIRFGNEPGRFSGATVKEFDSSADPDTNSYRITLTMPRPESVFALSGMNAWVDLPTHVGTQPIEVPVEALFNRQGQQAQVWKIGNDNRLSAQTVQFDDQGNLIDGLSDADRIVAAGVNQLTAGQLVRPWERERGI